MIRAAGVLFVDPLGSALFLKRSPAGDHAGEWCVPGGKIEGDETAEQAARREVLEETGYKITEPMAAITRTISAVGGSPSLPPIVGGAAPAAAVAAPVLPPPPVVPDAATVDFTTFLVKVKEQFDVKLDGEHTGFSWAPADSPPLPLHPGCQVAIDRLTWDELGVARAMADGRLVSPQVYQNVTLFKVRITGTGVSYRPKLNEFTYRKPEHYLTPDFLARCNGLTVIMLHPDKDTMDSKEFSDRVVGSMMLPFIEGDEVWGIAKVYDDDAIKIMNKYQMSTSPSVILRNVDSKKLKLEDGSTLLIEGKPTLLDHLAICEHGVWDKGEGPTGVVSVDTEGETAMADSDEKKEDKKADAGMPENLKKDSAKADAAKKDGDTESEMKADADGGTTLDKILKCVDGMNTKMDSFSARLDAVENPKKDSAKADEDEKKSDASKKDEDKKPGDSEKVAADAARKDEPAERSEMAEKIKETEAKKDSSVTMDQVKSMIEDVRSTIPLRLDEADEAAFTDAQSRADSVFMAFGKSAPRHQDGESLLGYRRRLANQLKGHSKNWKDVNLAVIGDQTAFGVAETQIFADAMHAANHPTDLPEGQLRPIHTRDATGRQSTSWVGEPRAWMAQFQPNRRRLVGIRNSRDH